MTSSTNRGRKIRRVGSLNDTENAKDCQESSPTSPKAIIEELRQANAQLQLERDEAVQNVQTLHGDRYQLCENFRLLRQKYDDLKAELQHTLWEFIPTACASGQTDNDSNDTRCCNINPFSELDQVNHSIFETSNRIGNYEIGNILGEGQFANVRLGTDLSTNKPCAVKIMNKSKIMSAAGLRRIQTEIKVLKRMKHPNVVQLSNVIHSTMSVYVITEIGGRDLFEFFEANPTGLPCDVVREITLGIARAIAYMHEMGYCHRDLKPENILVQSRGEHDNEDSGITCHNIKICDFGQCAEIENQLLSDLCGSPGFFAPEMILKDLLGEYYCGMTADVWSVGCILLELVLGHEEFCNMWMAPYESNVVRNDQLFERYITNAIYEVNCISFKSIDMGHFLKQLLLLIPNGRTKSADFLSHPWLSHGSMQRDDASLTCPDLVFSSSSDLSSCFENDDIVSKASRSCRDGKIETMPLKNDSDRDDTSPVGKSTRHPLNSANCILDVKERLHIGERRNSRRQREIRLPPIAPRTPTAAFDKS